MSRDLRGEEALLGGRFEGNNVLARAAEYFKDLDNYGSTVSSRLKVVLVGLPSAGKTSVASRLEGRALPSANERTVGVEIRDIQLGPGPPAEDTTAALDVKLWDFAGQMAYYDTHQVECADFLPPFDDRPWQDFVALDVML